MTKNKNEEAVSPVIGVILMVAITVILAAMIATFVFDVAGSVQSAKIVGFTAKQINATAIEVLYFGGQDDNKLTNVSINGEYYGKPKVGDIIQILGATSGNDRVTVIGTFDDNSQQILLDTRV